MQRWLYNTYLHCCEDHAGIRMLELWHDTFANVLALSLVCRLVPCKCIQDGHPAPLRAFIQRNKQFVQDRRSNAKGVRRRASQNRGGVNIG